MVIVLPKVKVIENGNRAIFSEMPFETTISQSADVGICRPHITSSGFQHYSAREDETPFEEYIA